ncbi:unnamed protein product, partial [Amoebophrya sp. A25]
RSEETDRDEDCVAEYVLDEVEEEQVQTQALCRGTMIGSNSSTTREDISNNDQTSSQVEGECDNDKNKSSIPRTTSEHTSSNKSDDSGTKAETSSRSPDTNPESPQRQRQGLSSSSRRSVQDLASPDCARLDVDASTSCSASVCHPSPTEIRSSYTASLTSSSTNGVFGGAPSAFVVYSRNLLLDVRKQQRQKEEAENKDAKLAKDQKKNPMLALHVITETDIRRTLFARLLSEIEETQELILGETPAAALSLVQAAVLLTIGLKHRVWRCERAKCGSLFDLSKAFSIEHESLQQADDTTHMIEERTSTKWKVVTLWDGWLELQDILTFVSNSVTTASNETEKRLAAEENKTLEDIREQAANMNFIREIFENEASLALQPLDASLAVQYLGGKLHLDFGPPPMPDLELPPLPPPDIPAVMVPQGNPVRMETPQGVDVVQPLKTTPASAVVVPPDATSTIKHVRVVEQPPPPAPPVPPTSSNHAVCSTSSSCSAVVDRIINSGASTSSAVQAARGNATGGSTSTSNACLNTSNQSGVTVNNQIDAGAFPPSGSATAIDTTGAMLSGTTCLGSNSTVHSDAAFGGSSKIENGPAATSSLSTFSAGAPSFVPSFITAAQGAAGTGANTNHSSGVGHQHHTSSS